MLTLGINASPRRNGNCSVLLKEALKGAKDAGFATETIFLGNLNISPWREGNLKDDMGKLIAKIVNADAILLASPIYFGSLSAQAKIMIDRCQVLWERKNISNERVRKNKAKAALILSEASTRKDFFKNAKQIAKNFFAVIEAEYKGELFCTKLENKKDALKRLEYLRKAYALGKNLID